MNKNNILCVVDKNDILTIMNDDNNHDIVVDNISFGSVDSYKEISENVIKL